MHILLKSRPYLVLRPIQIFGRYGLFGLASKFQSRQFFVNGKSSMNVLGIETSCDDTCVSLVKCEPSPARSEIIYQKTIRCIDDYEEYGGIHPLIALESHAKNIGPAALDVIKKSSRFPIDLISATRGPGMAGCLAQGLNFAKGIALGINKPFIGVHHMQAHTLMALMNNEENIMFPFLTLLISGGHTLLLLSSSVTEHQILVDTKDVAVGDFLDKTARNLKVQWNSQMPAQALENWSFSESNWSILPEDRELSLSEPLTTKEKHKSALFFTFSGLGASIDRLVQDLGQNVSEKDLKSVGRMAQNHAFAHVITRSKLAIKYCRHPDISKVKALVCSGGVARNSHLRYLLTEAFGPGSKYKYSINIPTPSLCSDNATMIAWAGYMMYRLGYASDLSVKRERHWPIDQLMSRNGWVYKIPPETTLYESSIRDLG